MGRHPERLLPILVVFHGDQRAREANTFAYVPVAQRLNSVVVTFNHRIGLLGFLPSSEPTIMTSASLASLSLPLQSSSSAPGQTGNRNNHALWDQIGLLHWLRHNALSLGADPNNVTLLASDGGASLQVQLLALSPLAKGLFNRIVMVDREEEQSEELDSLDKLLSLAAEARTSRRRLATHLGRIVQKLVNSPELPDERHVSEFILAANLTQLAEVDRELELLNSRQLLSLARQPTLDDKLLFPQLSPLIRRHVRAFDPATVFANYSRKLAQLKYCLYVSQLYQLGKDPVGLISLKSSSLREFIGDSHKESSPLAPAVGSQSRRILHSSDLFRHLWNNHKLNDLIISTQPEQLHNRVGRQQQNDSEKDNPFIELLGEEEQDDDDAEGGEGRNSLATKMRVYNITSSNDLHKVVTSTDNLVQKRSAGHFGDRFKGGNFEQLLTILSSFDLMVAFTRKPNSGSQVRTFNETAASARASGNFSNIIQAVINITRIFRPSGEPQLLSLLKFADLHSLASWTSDEESLASLCDFANRNDNPAIRAPAKSSRVLMLESTGSSGANTSDKWFVDSVLNDAQLARKYYQFLRLPARSDDIRHIDRGVNPSAVDWQLYNPMSRHVLVANGSGANEEDTIRRSVGIDSLGGGTWRASAQLDIIPYLNQLSEEAGNLSQTPDLIDSVLNCLNELDSSLGKFPLAHNELDDELQNIARLQEDSKCLTSSLAKLRAKLRQSGDLEMLLLKLQKHHQSHQYQRQNEQASRPLQPDQLINIEFERSLSASLEANESTSSNNSMILVARDSSQRVTVQRSSAPEAGGHASGFFKGFLAKVYKDAMGKALVATGVFIFVLNLAIVLFMTRRSARNRRRASRTVQDSTGSPREDVSSFSQRTAPMKSTLKKPDVVLTDRNYNETETIQLTPAITSVKSFSSFTATNNTTHKRLQFNLSGMPIRGSNGAICNQATTHQASDVGSSPSQQQGEQQFQNQIVLIDIEQQVGDELIMNAPDLMASYYDEKIDNQPSHLRQSDCTQNYGLVTDLGSPFASTSHSSGTNVTLESAPAYQQRTHLIQHQCGAMRGYHLAPCGNNNHSATSPGSSTSHSMTPVQLESFVNTTTGGNTTGNDISPSQGQQVYQIIEPIGLVYSQADSGYFRVHAPPEQQALRSREGPQDDHQEHIYDPARCFASQRERN